MPVTELAALLAGTLTCFAPCTFPLLPGYLAYLGGTANDDTPAIRRRKILRNAIGFVGGFSIVFVVLGMFSGAFGGFLVLYREALFRIGGALVLFFGLSMLEVFRFPQLGIFGRRIPAFITPGKVMGSLALGAVFALGWSPCLGPILGSILVLASATGGMLTGAYLLAWYALGMAIPFLLLAVFLDASLAKVAAYSRYLVFITRAGGAVFVLLGALMLAGKFALVTHWAGTLFDPSAFDWYYERI